MKSKLNTRVLIALLALIVSAIACADATPTAAPAEPDQAQAVEQPTDPPEPTNTPRPTEPEISADEEEYALFMMGNLTDFSRDADAMANLFFEAGDDPYVMFTDSWQADVEAQFRAIEGHIAKARAETPPDRFKDFHAEYMRGLDDMETAISFLRPGVRNFDIDSLETGLSYLNQGVAHMDNANRELDKIEGF